MHSDGMNQGLDLEASRGPSWCPFPALPSSRARPPPMFSGGGPVNSQMGTLSPQSGDLGACVLPPSTSPQLPPAPSPASPLCSSGTHRPGQLRQRA